MQTNTPNNADEPAFPLAIPLEHLECLYGLTARQYAAIHLRVPMSGNDWLDAMITEARRWDAAQAALDAREPKEQVAYEARQQAYALTRQMKGGAR